MCGKRNVIAQVEQEDAVATHSESSDSFRVGLNVRRLRRYSQRAPRPHTIILLSSGSSLITSNAN